MKPIDYVLTLLLSVSIFWISYCTSQTKFVLNFSLYTVAFVSFIGLYYRANQIGFKAILRIALGVHLIGLFSVPLLSPDWARFIWDGELLTMGINPFSATPNELIVQPVFQESGYFNALYSQITELSAEHYSCYPTINQAYFFLSAVFTDSIYLNIVILRIVMLATTMVGFYFGLKLLKLLNQNVNKIWIFALNPFVIIELTNNLHFEGVMLTFLLISLYFICKSNLVTGAISWALAVNVKLTPLILLPFLFKQLKFKKSALFYSLTIFTTVLLLFVLVWPSNVGNFKTSLALYFSNFEFNASILSLIKNFFYDDYGWETLKIIGPWVSKVALLIIVMYSLFYKVKSFQAMLTAMLFGFVIYLLFSSTVHPWYVAVPLGLSIFTPYKTIIIWSYTVMLSYVFYELGNSTLTSVLTGVEYVSLLSFLSFEVIKYKRRANAKHDNLQST